MKQIPENQQKLSFLFIEIISIQLMRNLQLTMKDSQNLHRDSLRRKPKVQPFKEYLRQQILSVELLQYICGNSQMESEQNQASGQQIDGRWLPEEHFQFLTAMMQHGKDWKIVEKQVETRTGSQVRSHAQKFFIKLNRFAKERRKGKNWELIHPQEIEREILQRFTSQQITDETPKEIVALLTCDWEQVRASFELKRKQASQKKASRKLKSKSKSSISEKEAADVLGDIQALQGEGHDSNDQSYFIRIIKSNKQHFKNGNDFSSLFDLGNHPSILQEEPQTQLNGENPIRRERSRSFSLPDEPNQNRLKQTLQNLHRALGYDN